jgi:uncharacterized membrane protein
MTLLQFYSMLHLLAVITWLGGMLFMNLILMPGMMALDSAQRGALIGAVAKRFSIAAWTSVIVLLITGVLKTPPGMMFAPASHYGGVLLLKHILILIAIIIGLTISLGVAPKLSKLAPKAGEAPSSEFMSAQKKLRTLSTTNMIIGVCIVIVISLR